MTTKGAVLAIIDEAEGVYEASVLAAQQAEIARVNAERSLALTTAGFQQDLNAIAKHLSTSCIRARSILQP